MTEVGPSYWMDAFAACIEATSLVFTSVVENLNLGLL